MNYAKPTTAYGSRKAKNRITDLVEHCELWFMNECQNGDMGKCWFCQEIRISCPHWSMDTSQFIKYDLDRNRGNVNHAQI